MIVILLATYPKCGNSALSFPLVLAGQLADSSYTGYDNLYKARLAHLRDNALPFKAIPGQETTIIKTHNIFKQPSDLITPQGEVSKVIRIIRNPFDCLLSALNFLRLEAKNSNNLAKIKPTIDTLFPHCKIIRRWTSPKRFAKIFTLDNLAKENLLDMALQSFSQSGLTLPFYYSVCGGWISNFESWSAASVPTLSLRYEDLTPSPSAETIHSIAEFVKTDRELLAKAFEYQLENVNQQKSSGSLFFNKASKDYYLNYFTAKAVNQFIDYNQIAIQRLGYEELITHIRGLD
ncbi:sulfotransferase domain-containing protein [Cyanobium sp. Lug-B]|uniref:sulfotransferase domain-containing protein n=1 Tax=Cyanobium sp. Lug-B TaxID=2823716 RepID=UPI0020CFBC37|nr:sulfotransferase domain-containing protein [Cyanobium sp. Lug-B]MCP9798173.1 sulfotransferase domain-containing protein [Cyanobium sp. Lug-B]